MTFVCWFCTPQLCLSHLSKNHRFFLNLGRLSLHRIIHYAIYGKDSFASFLSIWLSFLFPSFLPSVHLSILALSSSTLLNSSGESEHLCLIHISFLILRSNSSVFHFFIIETYGNCGFFIDSLYHVEEVSFHLQFSEFVFVFIFHDSFSDFDSFFPASIEMIYFFSPWPINIVHYIDWLSYVENFFFSAINPTQSWHIIL